MKINRVKTAIVGCGMISNIYIRNLSSLFFIIDLVAVCDINSKAAEEKAAKYGVPKIMTLDEIGASDEIELVVNLTAPVAHYSVIKQMLEAGKHVYTEKMFTTDLKQSEELVELAGNKGLYLGVAPDTILGAGLQTAKKLLDAGMIGDVTSGLVCINRNQSLNSEVYRFLRNPGGALPYDVGIYYVAALLMLLGPVESITAIGVPARKHEAEILYVNGEMEAWTIPGNNIISASLKFVNGGIVSVHFDGNTVNAEQSQITLFGEEGILKIGDPNTFSSSVIWIRPESGECIVPFTHGYDGANLALPPSPFNGYGNRGIGVAEMAWAIQNKRKHRCSKEYGLHCQEVLYGMDCAADTGKSYETKSRFEMRPLKSGYYSTMGGERGDAEKSLVD